MKIRFRIARFSLCLWHVVVRLPGQEKDLSVKNLILHSNFGGIIQPVCRVIEKNETI